VTCSALPIRDCRPHWQLARRWPLAAGAEGLTVRGPRSTTLPGRTWRTCARSCWWGNVAVRGSL